MNNALKFINVGLTFGITSAVAIYVGYLGGSWLDGQLGTDPIFMFLGVVLGIAATFRILIRDVLGVEDASELPADNDDGCTEEEKKDDV